MTDKLPVFSSADFEWTKGKGYSNFGKLGIKWFPEDGFVMKSHRTGESRQFSLDHEVQEANEFFDGEGEAYRDTDGHRCQIWVG